MFIIFEQDIKICNCLLYGLVLSETAQLFVIFSLIMQILLCTLHVGLICYKTEKYCSSIINKSYRMGFLYNTQQFKKARVSSLSVLTVNFNREKRPTTNPGVFALFTVLIFNKV